jgi:hypothetical protein
LPTIIMAESPRRPGHRRVIALTTLTALLVAGCTPPREARMAPPPRSPLDGHPHLVTAHDQIEAALGQTGLARNGDDGFGGHRTRAIELLRQARAEIRAAAIFADRHRD